MTADVTTTAQAQESLEVTLEGEVLRIYQQVAEQPEKEFHFFHGREAVEHFGYAAEWLDRAPAGAVASFAGVGNPHERSAIQGGETVLDLGSDAGLDAMIAAWQTGPSGRVIGIDLNPAMCMKTRSHAQDSGTKLECHDGRMESIPVDDETIDWRMKTEIPLLIIGAGPFGLGLAAHARSIGIGGRVIGEPMAFWRANMPKGMLLRSTCDWHLDPAKVHTIDAYLAANGQACADVEPLSLAFYLGYSDWFVEQNDIHAEPATVVRLDGRDGGFVATLEDGSELFARNVVVAVGLRYFANLPKDITSVLPASSFEHTCNYIDLESLRQRRCLIIGGRQSAFEWAALLRDAGAAAIHVCYRHDTPAFEMSDWSWVAPLVERTRTDGAWYRRLPEHEKDAIIRRMWQEGRAKLEPWLEPRIDHESVHLWPRTQVEAGSGTDDGWQVRLDNGQSIATDQILLATGYRVDMAKVPFLRHGTLWSGLELRDGYPCLDEFLQTSHAGLFITGQPAVRDFGPFFGFTVSVRASAERIGMALASRTG